MDKKAKAIGEKLSMVYMFDISAITVLICAENYNYAIILMFKIKIKKKMCFSFQQNIS